MHASGRWFDSSRVHQLIMKEKTCTKCLLVKSAVEFHRDNSKKDGLRYWCKSCAISNVRKWTQENPEHVRRVQKNNNLKKAYGITLEQYEEKKRTQHNKCAICDKKDQTLVVDHNHFTGHVRKLLCHRCNRVLGSIEENIDLLEAMIAYINQH